MFKGFKIAALCISKMHDEEKGKMVIALNKELVSKGYRLFIYNTCTDLYWKTEAEEGEKKIYELLDYSIIDAVIVHSESIKDEELKAKIINSAKDLRKPVFVIDGQYDGCINIQFDYVDGFAQMVRHVTDHHGCKKIHMLSGIKGNEFSQAREEVFKKILTQKGLELNENSISYGGFWRDPAKAAMEELIEKGNIPEAIVCANDAMAVTACTVLSEHNIKVPDDVIVTGFDGLEEIFFFTPTVTSCKYSYEKLAVKVIELLDRTFKQENVEGTYYVGEEMILNESCGCNMYTRINAADYVANLGGRLYRYQNDDCSFYERVANIHCLDNINDFYKELTGLNLYGLSCMVNSECTDETVNPLDLPYGESYSGDMFLLYRYDLSGTFEPHSFNKMDIAPDMDYMLEIAVPIIFNPLNFINVPLGYMCFYFAPMLEEYCRIPQIVNAFNIAIGGYRNIRYQKYITTRIDEFSKRDMLTGLYNRMGFFSMLHSGKKFSDGTYSVISIDMDGLKFINDNFGHNEGDSAIRAFAYALEKGCPGTKICGRFGGDEFAVVTDCTDADAIKSSIEAAIDRFNAKSGKSYKLSASFGIQLYNNQGGFTDFDEIFKQSDNLMYEEKRKKKNNRA